MRRTPSICTSFTNSNKVRSSHLNIRILNIDLKYDRIRYLQGYSLFGWSETQVETCLIFETFLLVVNMPSSVGRAKMDGNAAVNRGPSKVSVRNESVQTNDPTYNRSFSNVSRAVTLGHTSSHEMHDSKTENGSECNIKTFYTDKGHWYEDVISQRQYLIPSILSTVEQTVRKDASYFEDKIMMSQLILDLVEFYPTLKFFGLDASHAQLRQHALVVMQKYPQSFKSSLNSAYDFLREGAVPRAYQEVFEYNFITNPVDYLDKCYTLRHLGSTSPFDCCEYSDNLTKAEEILSQYNMVEFARQWHSAPLEYKLFLQSKLAKTDK